MNGIDRVTLWIVAMGAGSYFAGQAIESINLLLWPIYVVLSVTAFGLSFYHLWRF